MVNRRSSTPGSCWSRRRCSPRVPRDCMQAGIAEALIGQIQRAICRVSGGECRAVPEPCVVASTATQNDTDVRVAILRLARRDHGAARAAIGRQRAGDVRAAHERGCRPRPGRRDRGGNVGPGRARGRRGRGPRRIRARVDAAFRARGGRARALDRGASDRPRTHAAPAARPPRAAAARPTSSSAPTASARRSRATWSASACRSMPRTSSRPRPIAAPASARWSSVATANCSGRSAWPARSAPRPGWGATTARRWSSTRGGVRCASR